MEGRPGFYTASRHQQYVNDSKTALAHLDCISMELYHFLMLVPFASLRPTALYSTHHPIRHSIFLSMSLQYIDFHLVFFACIV